MSDNFYSLVGTSEDKPGMLMLIINLINDKGERIVEVMRTPQEELGEYSNLGEFARANIHEPGEVVTVFLIHSVNNSPDLKDMWCNDLDLDAWMNKTVFVVIDDDDPPISDVVIGVYSTLEEANEKRNIILSNDSWRDILIQEKEIIEE